METEIEFDTAVCTVKDFYELWWKAFESFLKLWRSKYYSYVQVNDARTLSNASTKYRDVIRKVASQCTNELVSKKANGGGVKTSNSHEYINYDSGNQLKYIFI